MKTRTIKNTAILLLLLLSGITYAQDKPEIKTLINPQSPIKISGFGGPFVAFSTINNDFAVSVGGGGAALFNDRFYVGGYGIGLATAHRTKLQVYNPITEKYKDFSNHRTSFGHGGFWLGALFEPYKMVHFGVSTKIGWGAIGLYEFVGDEGPEMEVLDRVFVANPMIEVELNVVRWFRVNVGAGYRFVGGVNEKYDHYEGGKFVERRNYFNAAGFNSPELTISLLFGGF